MIEGHRQVTPWEVVAWQGQLEAKGLYDPEVWEVRKVYPHATSVRRTFYTLDAAIDCYVTLSCVHRLPAFKNWL